MFSKIMKLITNLSTIMGKQRINQSELSRKTGIRQATIFQYYNDYWISIKREHIEKICHALNCTVSELFVFEDDKDTALPSKQERR